MFDPVTLHDDRDDLASYRVDTYNEPEYDLPAERGTDRASAIAAALQSDDWSQGRGLGRNPR